MMKPTPNPRGHPETRVIKLDATPEQAARAIFSAVKQPDPLRCIPKRPAKAACQGCV